jgi:hypothetical protein
MKSQVKEQARKLLEHLPEDATWQDLQYAIHVYQATEAGQADISAGRVYSSEAVRQRFELPPRDEACLFDD